MYIYISLQNKQVIKKSKLFCLLKKGSGFRNTGTNYSDSLCRKGKKYSLPAPKGGKHAVNPLLAVDQPQAQQRVSKKALARNNPLDPDYISGSSPFVVKARSFDH